MNRVCQSYGAGVVPAAGRRPARPVGAHLALGAALWIGLGAAVQTAWAQDTRPNPPTGSAPAPIAGSTGIPGVQPGMTIRQLLDLAQEKIEAGQLDVADAILAAVLEGQPRHLRALLLLDAVYTQQISLAEAALQANPAHPDAARRAVFFRQRLGQVCLLAAPVAIERYEMGVAEALYAQAIDGCKQLLAVNEKDSQAHLSLSQAKIGLARIHADTNRVLEAVEGYRDYLSDPQGKGDSQACLELARLYRQLRHTGQALAMLETAKRLNPEKPEIYLELALTYLDEAAPLAKTKPALADGKRKEAQAAAEAAYDRARRMGVDLHRYHSGLALVLVTRDKVQEADDNIHRAIVLVNEDLDKAPDNVFLLRSLESYYQVQGQVLWVMLVRAEKQHADTTGLRTELARLMKQSAELDKALSVHRALSVLPLAEGPNRDNLRLLEVTGELQLEARKLPEAAETCRRIRKLDPGNAVAHALWDRLPEEIRAEIIAPAPAPREPAATSPAAEP